MLTRRAILAGALATLPPRIIAAQQPAAAGRQHLGVLIGGEESNPGMADAAKALADGLAALGWREPGNLQIEWRWANGDRALFRRHAAELVALAPAAIVAHTSPAVEELRRRTDTIPIVFVIVTDPLGQGFVKTMAQPGGNITGFTDYDPPMAGKWLGFLTQISPPVKRVAVMFNPAVASFTGPMLNIIENTAPMLSLSVSHALVHDVGEIDPMIGAIGREAGGGLLMLPDIFISTHAADVAAAAARHRVPAVYGAPVAGGLISYRSYNVDIFRRSASYVDRILNGASPAALPIQNPTKFILTVNLKSAAAIGVEIAPSLVAAADVVIE